MPELYFYEISDDEYLVYEQLPDGEQKSIVAVRSEKEAVKTINEINHLISLGFSIFGNEWNYPF